MNQILENKKNRLINKKIYLIQFFIFFIILFSLVICFFWEKYSEKKIKKISETTKSSYNISKLYSNKANNNLITYNNSISIIGTIQIPKINISYPIFSQYTEEHLKISVCKLYGPNINNIGNLCIIGHNYNNNTFFSELYLLGIGDIINIYDINSNIISYYIFDKYEIYPDNLDYLSQETNGYKELTLITCNNFNREKINF